MVKNSILLVFSMLWFGSRTFAGNNDLKTARQVVGSVSDKYAPDKWTAVLVLSVAENSGQTKNRLLHLLKFTR